MNDDPPDHCVSWDLKGKMRWLVAINQATQSGEGGWWKKTASAAAGWSRRPSCGVVWFGQAVYSVCARVATRLAGSIGTREIERENRSRGAPPYVLRSERKQILLITLPHSTGVGVQP